MSLSKAVFTIADKSSKVFVIQLIEFLIDEINYANF